MNSDMLTTANGLELAYRAHGVGPTLVLLHAFPLNLRMWEPQLEALADHCHMIVPDLRGFGSSQITDGQFSVEDLASDVHALLERLGHTQVVMAGLSMGGYVALAYARMFPQTLRGLILADTRATADSEEARARRHKMIADVLAKGARPVAATMPATLVSATTASERPELVEQLKVWINGTDPRALMGAQFAMAERPDSTAILSELRVPTLLIVGEEDAVTPPEEMEAMQRQIHGASLVRIPGAGHLANMEAPEAFNQAVKAFMAQFPS